MVYSASLDLLAWIITISILLICATIDFVLIKYLPRKINLIVRMFAYSFSIGLPLAVLGPAFMYSPINYEVRDDMILVHRPIGNFSIEIKEIKSMSNIDRRISSTFKRTNASGGLFGYFGEVKDAWDRTYQFFATRKDRYVLIETIHGERYVLSPDDTDFVKHLEHLVKKPS